MLQQIWAISRNAFTESIRQPVFAVIVLVTTLAMLVNPALATYTLDDDNTLLIEMGLSTLFLAGLFMAVFTATGVLCADMDNKAVLTIISKPVARPLFIVGKYLGVVGALTVAYWAVAVIFLLSVRHGVLQTVRDPFDGPVLVFGGLAGLIALAGAAVGNYYYRWVFASSFVLGLGAAMTIAWALVLLIGKGWRFQVPTIDFSPQLMIGLLLIFQLVLILAALATATATIAGRITTMVVCIGVFVLGMASDQLRHSLSTQSELAGLLCLVLPNLQSLWPTDALIRGHVISGRYVLLVSLYSTVYITALLALAVGLFQRREIR